MCWHQIFKVTERFLDIRLCLIEIRDSFHFIQLIALILLIILIRGNQLQLMLMKWIIERLYWYLPIRLLYDHALRFQTLYLVDGNSFLHVLLLGLLSNGSEGSFIIFWHPFTLELFMSKLRVNSELIQLESSNTYVKIPYRQIHGHIAHLKEYINNPLPWHEFVQFGIDEVPEI